jgi:hypothetical protein
MGPSDGPSLPSRLVWRLALLAAALDLLTLGLWAVTSPWSLFDFLHMHLSTNIPPDRLQLWWALGFVALAHAGVLAMLAWRPEAYGPLALVPLIGRAIQVGLWFWVWGTVRLRWPLLDSPLQLAAHDAVWLPVLAGFLLVWWRWRQAANRASPLLADRKTT